MAAKDINVHSKSNRWILPEYIDLICKDGKTVRIEANLFNRIHMLNRLKWKRKNSINVDFDSDIINHMLEYLRHGNPQLDSFERKKDLYKLSIQFGILDLRDWCRNELNREANEDNVCSLHDLACLLNDTHLQFYCWKKFDTYSYNVFFKEDFLNCTKNTIQRIVSRPISTVQSEKELFLAVYKWANRQKDKASDLSSNLRPYLDEFIPDIRFLAMSRLDLETIFPLNVLNQDEKQRIKRYLEDGSVILPEYMNKTRDGRNPDKYSTLFEYLNKNEQTNKNKTLNKKCKFIAEFKTKYDCFLIGLKLPITHISNVNGITVNVKIIFPDAIILLQTEKCLQSGRLILQTPVFISKTLESVKVEAKISEEERLANPTILIPYNTSYYLPESEKHFYHRDKIYAKIKLWF